MFGIFHIYGITVAYLDTSWD